MPVIFSFKTEKKTAGRDDSLTASTNALVVLTKKQVQV